ncbi:hypothetical protein SUGI_0949520 [Cryptomeria japonica]|nr:hypothetical protein SUGI_0949520 [Cryptomeria japonica]
MAIVGTKKQMFCIWRVLQELDFLILVIQLTMWDNLRFLLAWFKKIPEFKTRELYLTGESYAGHYIPQLADLIVRTNRKQKVFNLKSVAIGNPLLDFYKDQNAVVEYSWSHGLISDPTYKMMIKDCNYARYIDESYRRNISNTCKQIYKIAGMEGSRYIDDYDVTLDVCLSSPLMQAKLLRAQMNRARVETEGAEPDVCFKNEITTYLNRPEVLKAIHARIAGGTISWKLCSDSDSLLEYDGLNAEKPTIGLLGKLWRSGFSDSSNRDKDIDNQSCFRYVTEHKGSLQCLVAGWTQVYGNILSFATVRGAGHAVPLSQPERALVLFKAFLSAQPLPSKF